MVPEKNKEFFFKEGCFITELLNSSADHEVSVARARVCPGKTTRWHRLAGITERYIILQGQGLIEIGSDHPQRVASGDTVYISPAIRQRITNIGKEDLIFLAVCTPRFVEDAYEDLE